MPDDEPIVPTVVLLLLHLPPAVALLSDVVAPVQTRGVPSIADGKALTVTITVAAMLPQPFDSV